MAPNNGPKVWARLLGDCPKGSVLMGGAVVDYTFGVTPKDFDIFYPYQPGAFDVVPDSWIMTDADFNDPKWVAEHNEWYLQGVDENGAHPIMSVTEYRVDGKYLVQMIGVSYPDARTHFKNFDHSLTKAYFSERGWFMGRQVLDSIDTGTITYVRGGGSDVEKSKSLARAKAKAERYGGVWKFVGFE